MEKLKNRIDMEKLKKRIVKLFIILFSIIGTLFLICLFLYIFNRPLYTDDYSNFSWGTRIYGYRITVFGEIKEYAWGEDFRGEKRLKGKLTKEELNKLVELINAVPNQDLIYSERVAHDAGSGTIAIYRDGDRIILNEFGVRSTINSNKEAEILIDYVEELHDKYLYGGVTYIPKPPQIEELEKLIDDIEELHDKYLYGGVTYTPKPPQIEELEK